MRLDVEKVELMQARSGKTLVELGIGKHVLYHARHGQSIRPVTLHKIATALNCDPADLIRTEEK